MDAPNPLDQRVELLIGKLLRTGVAASAILVLIGGVIYLRHHGHEHPNYSEFHGVPADLRTINGTFELAREGRGVGLIQLGVLVLVATPVARVAFALVAFILERDWRYVLVTTVVLIVLGYSLIHGYLH